MAIVKAFSSDFYQLLREMKKRDILFFNGCFDIVHLGHLKMIKDILKLKNRYHVICGLNSDISVRAQNKSHPLVNDEMSRAQFIQELGVDRVIIFDEETPKALLMNLIPDVVYKGEEYRDKDYDEKEYLRSIRCDINYYQHIAGYSTTNTYNTIAEQVKKDIRKQLGGN